MRVISNELNDTLSVFETINLNTNTLVPSPNYILNPYRYNTTHMYNHAYMRFLHFSKLKSSFSRAFLHAVDQ